MEVFLVTFAQDLRYQYADGRDLLVVTLMEREQLLHELANMAKAAQVKGNTDVITQFDILRAQTLLYELLISSEKIDSLVVLINHYAKECELPRVEIREATP